MKLNNAPQDLQKLFSAFVEERTGIHPSLIMEPTRELLWNCWYDGYISYGAGEGSY